MAVHLSLKLDGAVPCWMTKDPSQTVPVFLPLFAETVRIELLRGENPGLGGRFKFQVAKNLAALCFRVQKRKKPNRNQEEEMLVCMKCSFS